jgi:hypothetical protein
VHACRLIVLVFALQWGCAYVNPLLDAVPTSRPDEKGGASMPLLWAALADADVRIAAMEAKRNATVWTARLLDLLTFGFASGAAYAALTQTHAQSVLNLGIAAAATYTGSTLFAPTDVANVYQAGIMALACVANRGSTLRSAVERYGAQVAIDDAKQLPAQLADGCRPDQEVLSEALAAQDKAKRLLDYAIGADPEEASRVRQASNGVLNAVNREVLKRSNSPDVIFAAARGLVAHSTGNVIEARSQSISIGTERARLPACNSAVNQRIRDFTATYAEIGKNVTAAMNAMASLDTSCVLEPLATEALTLSNEEVTVTKDASFSVLISGGRPPYAIAPSGAGSKDVSVQLIVPRTIVVTGLSTIKGESGPFTYEVKDNSVITSPKALKILTK